MTMDNDALKLPSIRLHRAAKIETSVFPMHKYHIIFVLTGEKGVEISACVEALGANFDGHCVMS